MTETDLALYAFREMVKSPLQGGSLTFGETTIDCTVGIFSKRDMLVNGGISPMMVGDVQLALEDVEDNVTFPFGMQLTVTPKTGRARACTVFTADYSGPFVTLVLHDANEGA